MWNSELYNTPFYVVYSTMYSSEKSCQWYIDTDWNIIWKHSYLYLRHWLCTGRIWNTNMWRWWDVEWPSTCLPESCRYGTHNSSDNNVWGDYFYNKYIQKLFIGKHYTFLVPVHLLVTISCSIIVTECWWLWIWALDLTQLSFPVLSWRVC